MPQQPDIETPRQFVLIEETLGQPFHVGLVRFAQCLSEIAIRLAAAGIVAEYRLCSAVVMEFRFACPEAETYFRLAFGTYSPSPDKLWPNPSDWMQIGLPGPT
jgi:hypothetical protein